MVSCLRQRELGVRRTRLHEIPLREHQRSADQRNRAQVSLGEERLVDVRSLRDGQSPSAKSSPTCAWLGNSRSHTTFGLSFVKFYPLGVRSHKTGVRSLRENRNEFERMSIRVTKVNLRRWHPTDH